MEWVSERPWETRRIGAVRPGGPPNGIVHVWRVPADAGARDWGALLNADEAARAARFHFEADRCRSAAARGALRALLGGYLGVQPRALQFTAGAQGKPALMPQDSAAAAPPLHFNGSHSGGWVMLAFAAAGPVGVDLERHREVEAEALVQRFFAEKECRVWAASPPAERIRTFFALWTLKEAFLKATGRGLSRDPRTFQVVAEANGEARLDWCAEDPGATERWRLRLLPFADGYSAAVAAGADATRVEGFTLAP